MSRRWRRQLADAENAGLFDFQRRAAWATRSLAAALAPKRDPVNGVAFASIMSNILQEKLREDPDLRDRMIAATPLAASPVELAATGAIPGQRCLGFVTSRSSASMAGAVWAIRCRPGVF